jgi:hypothetical protein
LEQRNRIDEQRSRLNGMTEAGFVGCLGLSMMRSKLLLDEVATSYPGGLRETLVGHD